MRKIFLTVATMLMIGLIAIGSVMAADTVRNPDTAYQNYLPIIEKPEAPTPTPTSTPMPTAMPTEIPTANIKIDTIVYNPSGSDAAGEYVRLRNDGAGSAQMEDWRLSDEADTTFIFPPFTLASGQTVTVWVRSGTNNSGNLYWNRDAATWNNSGDTAYLRNSAGQIVDTCSYSGGGSSHDC